MLESGAAQRITEQWSESQVKGDCNYNNGEELKPVAIEKTAFLFVLLSFGMTVSFSLYILENVIKRRR